MDGFIASLFVKVYTQQNQSSLIRKFKKMALDINAGIAGFLGVCLFTGGLRGSLHAKSEPQRARLFFWITTLGAVFFFVSTYALQFRSAHRQPANDTLFFFVWGFVGMLTLSTGVNAFRSRRQNKSI